MSSRVIRVSTEFHTKWRTEDSSYPPRPGPYKYQCMFSRSVRGTTSAYTFSKNSDSSINLKYEGSSLMKHGSGLQYIPGRNPRVWLVPGVVVRLVALTGASSSMLWQWSSYSTLSTMAMVCSHVQVLVLQPFTANLRRGVFMRFSSFPPVGVEICTAI